MGPGSQELSGAEIGIILVFYGVICLTGLAIQLFICFVMYNSAKSIPENFQKAIPGQAFLMLIPLFNLVWLFIYPKNLSLSFQEYFHTHNQRPDDDCGEKIGLYWAIASICSMIPCLGIFFGLGGLVCMIMYLIKVNECKNRALRMAKPGISAQNQVPTHPPRKSDNPYDSGY